MPIHEVCSPVNKPGGPQGKPTPLSKRSLLKSPGVNSNPDVPRGGSPLSSSTKLSQVGRYAPGTLIGGQITVASDPRK
jgi:hypothetical protein